MLWGCICRKMTLVVHANTDKEGIGEQDKRDMAIPSDEASDLILIEAEIFGRFQVFLDMPSCANGPNHLSQRRYRRGKHQIIGFFVWVINTATD